MTARKRKVVLLLGVILGLAPGTWLRTPSPPADTSQVVGFVPLPAPEVALGPLELAGAWALFSPNDDFGSYSALVALGDGTLLAAGDQGAMMRFSPPGARATPARIGYFGHDRNRPKRQLDMESMTRDPASGHLWVGFEHDTRIERLGVGFRPTGTVRPEAMRDWPANQGAEAMTRLADGRFIVIAEGSRRWFDREMPGLLFPSDPVAGVAPSAFRFVPPSGYRAVDMAELPDGRVLILLRKVVWGIPPGFAGKLMLADPAMVRAGQVWHAKPLADLKPPLPSDNFEGMAVVPEDGGVTVWLISDDNNSSFQRTLLLKLRWPANAKARGSNPRASSIGN